MDSQVIVEYNKRLSLYRKVEKYLFEYVKKECPFVKRIEIDEFTPIKLGGVYYYCDITLTYYLTKGDPYIIQSYLNDIRKMVEGYFGVYLEDSFVKYE